MFINLQRDYVITGFRQMGQLKNIIIAADKLGKIKAIVLYITLSFGLLIAYLRYFAFMTGSVATVFNIILYVLIGITSALMIISEITYIAKNPDVLKDNKTE